MKINPNISAGAIQRYNNVIRQAKTAEPAAAPSGQSQDRVELSAEGLQFAEMVKAAKNASDFSTEKVDAIRQSIQDGTYSMSSAAVSQKIIEGNQYER